MLEVIFTKSDWNEILQYVLKSQTTEDIFYTMDFDERELFIEELFRRYIQNSPEEMTEGIYEILLAPPFAIITVKGFLTSGTADGKKSKVQKANEMMVSKCTSGISAFDYGDLMFNATDDYRNKWMMALDDFKDSSKKAHSIGSNLEKRFDKFKLKLSNDSVFVDQVSYDRAWDDLETAVLEGDVNKVEELV